MNVVRVRTHSSVAANSGSSGASIASPKLSLVYSPTASTDVYANWGRGFHSNDARGTVMRVDPRDAATPVGCWNEPLRHDVAKGLCQSRPNDLLFILRKGADDALDGFRGVDRVQRRENEVASLSSFEGDFHRLAIAHLADQNHLGRLSQRRPQSQSKVRGI